MTYFIFAGDMIVMLFMVVLVVWVFWRSSDETIADAAQIPLAPGQSYAREDLLVNLPLDASLSAGNYYLIVQSDVFNDQPEGDESNNSIATAAIALALPPLPDLQVQNITFVDDVGVVLVVTQKKVTTCLTLELRLGDMGTITVYQQWYTMMASGWVENQLRSC